MAADKRYPKSPEGLRLGGTGIPSKFGTFTPPVGYITTDAAIEQRIQDEQEAVADVIRDAVALLTHGSSDSAKRALRARAAKLSPSARITARTLTKLLLDQPR